LELSGLCAEVRSQMLTEVRSSWIPIGNSNEKQLVNPLGNFAMG
jgi:hypothetical protein